MVQTFNVLRCSECEAFQVQLEKMAKTFSCSLCGAKQSLQRIYAKSLKAKDCRELVMQYNAARGVVKAEADATAEQGAAEGWAAQDSEEQGVAHAAPAAPAAQKWKAFEDEKEVSELASMFREVPVA